MVLKNIFLQDQIQALIQAGSNYELIIGMKVYEAYVWLDDLLMKGKDSVLTGRLSTMERATSMAF